MAKKKSLEAHEVKQLGAFDSASRWYPIPEVSAYFSKIRSPSRSWPYSYYKAAFTQKFYKWLESEKLLHLVK